MIGFVGFILAAATVYGILFAVRKRHSNPKYVPTQFLKERWKRWGAFSRGTYEPAGVTEPAANIGTGRASSANGNSNNVNASNSSRVNRNTSIRSVMTLPPYRTDPANTEQVIGREGERDGVDVVVEMPTEEALESLREEEMEALYQIRLARRQQNAEREERREARRAARERNDELALEVLRSRNTRGADRAVIEELRADYQRLKEQRRGAVPSVSYADIGVARHDGTRIRANSSESERVGLLSDAASIAQSAGDRRSSAQLRGLSDSAMSMNTDVPSPSLYQRSRASSAAGSAHVSTHMRGDSASDVGETTVGEADVGESDIPLYSPPGYEDASDDGPSTTPVAEPPPGYPGQDTSPEQRTSLVSERIEETAEEARETGDSARPRSGVDGTPQLPSLRLGRVPRIVIEGTQDQASERQ